MRPDPSESQTVTHYFQVLVLSVDPGEIDEMCERALAFLHDEGIIELDDAPRAPGGRMARPPGPHWQQAIVEYEESFLQEGINGVECELGRQVFTPGDYDVVMRCPKCGAYHKADDAWQSAARRYEAGQKASLRCGECGDETPVERWLYDPPIGFGNIGLVFWNWPSINHEFIEQMGLELETKLYLVEGEMTET